MIVYEAYDDPATVKTIVNMINEYDWATYDEILMVTGLDRGSMLRGMLELFATRSLNRVGETKDGLALWEVC